MNKLQNMITMARAIWGAGNSTAFGNTNGVVVSHGKVGGRALISVPAPLSITYCSFNWTEATGTTITGNGNLVTRVQELEAKLARYEPMMEALAPTYNALNIEAPDANNLS